MLEIALLGPPVVRSHGRDVLIPSRKSAALLYYLAANVGRPLSRGQLVVLLWEESGEAEGRNNLSTTLSRLRHALATHPPFPLRSAGDTLQWDDTNVQTDLAQLVRLTAPGDETVDPRDLEAAVQLYRGPFLDGFEVRDSDGYDAWLRQERERWQQSILSTVQRLIALYQRREQFAPAILHAQRALAIDPFQEQMHRTLMELYYRSGDRASALAQFVTCERLLREGLGVAPAPETRALREAIATGRLHYPRSTTAASPSRPPHHATAAPPSRRARYPFVGREAELRHLRQTLQETSGHRGRLVVVQGEAGIGKTRLTEELLGQLGRPLAGAPASDRGAMEQWTVLVGHSYQDARGLPYHPIVEALRSQPSLLGRSGLDLPDVWLAEINRLLPEIGVERPHLPAPVQLDPQQERRRLFEGIAQYLAALRPPRLLVLEDLHWADGETLYLLAYLVRHEELRDTLFLATVRSEDLSEELDQILTSLEYEGRLDRLVLVPLSAAVTATLVQTIIQGSAVELAEQAYRETEGNPLFTVELVRSLLESGAWNHGRPASGLERLALPPTVQAVIRARLARLDPSSRELLNSAAVFRQAFDFDDVRTVAGQAEEVALTALETLLRVHILRETTPPVAAGVVATRYNFSHDQIRRAVYESLSDARRRLLHRRVFEVLAEAPAGRGAHRAEELAYHACRGQSWSTALEWSERAAGNAMQVFAYASAVHLYEQALACAAQLPATPELRWRVIDLRLQLARVGFYVQPGRLIEWLEPAEAEASLLGDAPRLAQVWLAQASALYIQGQLATALPRLQQLQGMAESTGDALLQAQTANVLGRLLVIRGELGRGLEALERALAAMESEENASPIWPATPLERLVSAGLAACAYAFRGQFAAAVSYLDRFAQLATAPTDASVRAVGVFYRALIAHTQGDWTATITFATEAIANARAAANLIYEYVSHVYLGLALARVDRVAEGLDVQRTALALAERAQTRVILGRAYAWLGEILLLAGQVDAADEAARMGEALSDEHGNLFEAALCARVRGEICTARGAWGEATAALERARTGFEALEAWPEWARAEAAVGRLCLARADHLHARAHLDRAARRFAEMEMVWDLAQTRSALSAPPP